MARKKKTEHFDEGHEKPLKVAPKKQKEIICVTEEEYEAHRDELEKLDNIIIFMDDGERDYWFAAEWLLGGIDTEEDL